MSGSTCRNSVVGVLVALMTTGCITYQQQGASGCQIKKALVSSFTFTATDRLYPRGTARPGEYDIDSAGTKWIETRLELYAKVLREAHGSRHEWVSTTMETPVVPKLEFAVDVTDTRSPITLAQANTAQGGAAPPPSRNAYPPAIHGLNLGQTLSEAGPRSSIRRDRQDLVAKLEARTRATA